MEPTNHHKFGKIPTATLENGYEHTCVKCGQKIIRYKSGATGYILPNGSKSPYTTKCEIKYVESPVGLVLPISTPVELLPMSRNLAVIPDLNLKARFTELLVMLRCATDELPDGRVKAMCTRFLYSQDHKQIVKQIQSI